LVEEGRIYFLYRPRVNVDHPTSLNDIQRFFMIMAPTNRPKAPFRLHIIGKKRLPIPDKHERFFCFTEATAGKVSIGMSTICIAHMLLVTLTLVYSDSRE